MLEANTLPSIQASAALNPLSNKIDDYGGSNPLFLLVYKRKIEFEFATYVG